MSSPVRNIPHGGSAAWEFQLLGPFVGKLPSFFFFFFFFFFFLRPKNPPQNGGGVGPAVGIEPIPWPAFVRAQILSSCRIRTCGANDLRTDLAVLVINCPVAIELRAAHAWLRRRSL